MLRKGLSVVLLTAALGCASSPEKGQGSAASSNALPDISAAETGEMERLMRCHGPSNAQETTADPNHPGCDLLEGFKSAGPFSTKGIPDHAILGYGVSGFSFSKENYKVGLEPVLLKTLTQAGTTYVTVLGFRSEFNGTDAQRFRTAKALLAGEPAPPSEAWSDWKVRMPAWGNKEDPGATVARFPSDYFTTLLPTRGNSVFLKPRYYHVWMRRTGDRVFYVETAFVPGDSRNLMHLAVWNVGGPRGP